MSSEYYRLDEGTQVIFGEPANYPHELVNALKQLFVGLKQVKRAYLAHIYVVGKDENPHTLIGIEVSEDWEQVITKTISAMQGIKIPEPPVDIIQITGNGGIGGDYFLNKGKPFYRKKILGLF